MNILVTGAKGFIGKNLILELKSRDIGIVYEYDVESTIDQLETYTKDCDFVFHLAGVNRPEKESDFMEGNFGFTSVLLDALIKQHNKAPILMTSSIQALQDNPYGKSKKAGEELFLRYQKETGAKVLIYRLQNVFGKWCRPNYNSVVATFCHNIANDLPITINDKDQDLSLIYIDDVVNTFLSAMEGNESSDSDGLYYVKEVYRVKLEQLAQLIYSFKESRKTLIVPDVSDGLTKKLYSTYLSYLPTSHFSYCLNMHSSNKGSFTEIIKTMNGGQVSVNISKPGITKGNHWHHSKIEKFLVVSGQAVIKFRKLDSEEIVEYKVSGEKLEAVDIPPGYTHAITNAGETDLVTIMWANEPFDPDHPDTIYLEV